MIATAVAAWRFGVPQNPVGRKIAEILAPQGRRTFLAPNRSAATCRSSFQKAQGKLKTRVAPPRNEGPVSARAESGNVHAKVSGLLRGASPERSFAVIYGVQELPHLFPDANSSLESYSAPAACLSAIAHLTLLPARQCHRGFKSPRSHGCPHLRTNVFLLQETCRHLHRDLQKLPVTLMRPGASKTPAHRELKGAPKGTFARLLCLESSSIGEVAFGERK